MTYRYNLGLAFSEIAARMGDRPALKPAHGGAISYAELDGLSNRLAAVLQERGLRRRDVVAIVHDKSPRCYATMLAALKMGVTYVNVDDQNPEPRLQHIFDSARPQVVVGESLNGPIRNAADWAKASTLEFSDASVRRDLESAGDGDVVDSSIVTGADPAYIMYTSGSTGVPKGALMTHANVLNFGAWTAKRFAIVPQDVLTNVNPMYFDNSVFDFYGAVLNGASLAPIARETLSDGAELVRQVESTGCTIWFSVPSLLIYLQTMKLVQPGRFPAVRAFVFGGEGYPKPELRKLHAAFGSRSLLVNVYGPTECTCICSAWDVRAEDLADDDGFVTLGQVAANFSMLVLEEGRQVAPGSTGELCLLGPQVGLGYVNDPERTARAFSPNPLNARWNEPMYRTGDLVRLGEDGRRLDFVGRRDNQVKHMGYRIELEEIEAGLNRIEGVVQSAVLQKTTKRGHKILVAYVASDRAMNEPEMRAALEGFLPPYMIPQAFDIRSTLPKNANGKIDKIALAAYDSSTA